MISRDWMSNLELSRYLFLEPQPIWYNWAKLVTYCQVTNFRKNFPEDRFSQICMFILKFKSRMCRRHNDTYKSIYTAGLFWWMTRKIENYIDNGVERDGLKRWNFCNWKLIPTNSDYFANIRQFDDCSDCNRILLVESRSSNNLIVNNDTMSFSSRGKLPRTTFMANTEPQNCSITQKISSRMAVNLSPNSYANL
jgi:hypothetical protein